MPFQRRNWWIQRIGWALFLLILVLAVLGLFGEGLLSAARHEGGSATIEFSRCARRGVPTRIVVELHAGSSPSPLVLSRSFADRLRADSVIPPAAHNTATRDGLILEFGRPANESDRWVRFEVVYHEAGLFDGWISIAGGTPLRIRQFVYP